LLLGLGMMTQTCFCFLEVPDVSELNISLMLNLPSFALPHFPSKHYIKTLSKDPVYITAGDKTRGYIRNRTSKNKLLGYALYTLE
jgi:hypothetical protein